MIFHDFFYDRETEAGALGPRRHIRLGEALAALDREAAAIVGDAHLHLVRQGGDHDRDLAGRRAAVRPLALPEPRP